MTHEELRDRLLDLAYGELSPGEAREVEAHAVSCEACRAELASIRGTRQVMSALPVEPAPERGERILTAAAREAVRDRAPRRAWPRWLWAAPVVAASLAVVLAVSLRVEAPPPPSAFHEDPSARGEAMALQGAPPAQAPSPETPAPVAGAPAAPRLEAEWPRAAKGAPAPREAAPLLADEKAEAAPRDRADLRGLPAPPEEAPHREAERFASAPAAPPAAAAPAPAPQASGAAPAPPHAGAAPQAGLAGAMTSAPSPAPSARAEAKQAEEAPPPARRAKALAARPGAADEARDAAAGAGAAEPLSRAIGPRDRALAAARARASAIGYSMAGTTVEVGVAPVTWDEWRAQAAAGPEAAPPAGLDGRRFWPVVFRPSQPARGGELTVLVEDGTFRALGEVREQ